MRGKRVVVTGYGAVSALGNNVPETRDAICIGAGISSRAFGAQVVQRHPGARILVIDKHASAGDDFEAVLPDGSIRCGNEADACHAALCARFPHERAGLDRFFEEVAIHGRNGYYRCQTMDGSVEPDVAPLRDVHRHLKHLTVAQALAERIGNPWLREILAATGIHVGGFPEDLGYLYFLRVVYATLTKGNAYVEGASPRLSDVLADRIVAAGGQLVPGTTVYLATDVAPAELGLASTETMIVACGADASLAARAGAVDEDAREQAYWSDGVMAVTNHHALDPTGGRIVRLNVLDTIAHWPERRSVAYKFKKVRAREKLLERLYAAKPGLRGHVVTTEVATPRTSRGAGSGYEAAFGHAETKVRQWAA